ncbi:MAG: twin-arginine translocase TatA/TatE family subunit [Bacteroidales bacterium]|nr:twin-arginine translocase TatA/TatE family subunit [Bacteroidales bacterium]
MLILMMPGGYELILVLLVVVLLFGGKKIPELMRGLGKGMSEFKKATAEVDEIKKEIEKPLPDEKSHTPNNYKANEKSEKNKISGGNNEAE